VVEPELTMKNLVMRWVSSRCPTVVVT
jgi:hypothetical protein